MDIQARSEGQLQKLDQTVITPYDRSWQGQPLKLDQDTGNA